MLSGLINKAVETSLRLGDCLDVVSPLRQGSPCSAKDYVARVGHTRPLNAPRAVTLGHLGTGSK